MIDGQTSRRSRRTACATRLRWCRRISRCFTARCIENYRVRPARSDAARKCSPPRARRAATDFIEAMPEGFDTIVGDRGVQALGRPAPAHRDCARDPEERADPAARRSDLRARQRLGGSDPAGARPADGRPHGDRDRAPPVDAAEFRPHHRDERGQGDRRRHAPKSCATVRASTASCSPSSMESRRRSRCPRSRQRDPVLRGGSIAPLHLRLRTALGLRQAAFRSRMKLSRHTDTLFSRSEANISR